MLILIWNNAENAFYILGSFARNRTVTFITQNIHRTLILLKGQKSRFVCIDIDWKKYREVRL